MYQEPREVTAPNGKTRLVNWMICEGLKTGEYSWYPCHTCGGVDSGCEYCLGTGYDTLTDRESKYGWIRDALDNQPRIRRQARIRLLRIAIARPIARLANSISPIDIEDLLG